MTSKEKKSLEVTTELAGSRLDFFLSSAVDGLSRRDAKRACDRGEVRVDGRRNRAGCILAAGQIVELEQELKPVRPRPELLKAETIGQYVTVLERNEQFIVLNKARGVPSVVLHNDDPITVADCLAFLAPESIEAGKDYRESGLVQRLDTWTSGLIIAGCNPEAWDWFHEALQGGAVTKTYLALVEGVTSKQHWDVECYLRSIEGGRKVKCVYEPQRNDLLAQSHFAVICSGGSFLGKHFIVEASGGAMRRHQVRAHLASSEHPLVGDELYGSRESLAKVLSNYGIEFSGAGFLLHANSLSFKNPWTSKEQRFSADNQIFLDLKAAWQK